MLSQMLTTVLKAVKMLLSCCPKNSQDAAVLTALQAVQDAEKNHPHKDQVQRLILIILPLSLVRRLVRNLDHPGLEAELQEPDPPKRLDEQVCKLVLGVDVACLDAPFLLTALKAVQDVEKNHPHKDQVQRLIPIRAYPPGIALHQGERRHTAGAR
jgi:hypothetical protein